MSEEKNKEILDEIDAEIIQEILQESEESTEFEQEFDPEKEKKRRERRQALQIAVANGNTDTLIRKVAYILNKFPETRNSDIALQVQYWRTFEGFTGNSVSTDKLFEYERLTSITRSRQKIQNEYKLYQADKPVRKWRRNLDELEREKQIANKPEMPIIFIYADETGKQDKYVIVASIWILNERAHADVFNNLKEWRTANKNLENFPKEFHFKEVDNRGKDLHHYINFFDTFMGNSEMVSFKAVTVNKQKLDRMSVSDIIKNLYTQLVRTGIEHEKSTGRISPPKQISYTKDDEGESRYQLIQIQQDLSDMLKIQHDEDFKLNSFASLPSDRFDLLQIADLFAASLNRRYNLQPNSNNRNAKDGLTNHILNAVDLVEFRFSAEDLLQTFDVNLENDRSTLFIFD
ncbi:DUF3800 domain-containing protein [Ornithinibacillus halotolerans]|uniref:DUF3800 domain-containing protein n=1 Tax=Ornithinibacillus halotolerans TaxID=1274357 RepID=A0A916RSC2_9BACI|nr:DUF3800 domain-containing protein [Ornithinibacillus halotolerans]GGA65221.1 hypothetical protein GCM10008025_06350 [Ornithinibacillus halotolerans]